MIILQGAAITILWSHIVFIKLKDERWYIEDQWDDKTPLSAKRAPLPPAELGVDKNTGIPHQQEIQSTAPQSRQAGVTPMPPAGGR